MTGGRAVRHAPLYRSRTAVAPEGEETIVTAKNATVSLTELLGDVKVVDVDAHFTEPPDLWTSRAPARYKDQVPHMKTVDGQSAWFVEGDHRWLSVGVGVMDRAEHKDRGKLTLTSLDEMSEAVHNVKARLRIMDQLGIYAQITYPNACGFGALPFLSIQDAELRIECVKLYNDACAEWQAESNGRLFPQALLPLWDIDATLKELRRVREELRLTGVTITDRTAALGLPDFTQPHWEPFWELVNDLELPLDFHIGAGLTTLAPMDAFTWPSFGLMRKVAVFASIAYTDTAPTILNFLHSGLFDRYPKVKLVSVESGCGWIPFLLEAAEWHLDEMVPDAGKNLRRRPREYFKDHIYTTFWFEQIGVKQFVEALGAENLLFLTDYPHPTALYTGWQERVAHTLAQLPPDARRRIMQDNAVELYKLPVPRGNDAG